MTITLKIDNLDSLPDGGPVRFQARNRGFEIGRDQHLDWTLPDPSRYVSGRHCEVRFEEGAYWLYDVSSNGTYLNGSMQRMKSPYRLVDGDRLAIGNYIIAVEVRLAESQPASERYVEPPPPVTGDNIWDVAGDVPSPVDRREFMPPPERRRDADFSEQFLDFPIITPSAPFPGEPAPFPADPITFEEPPRFAAAPLPDFSLSPEPTPPTETPIPAAVNTAPPLTAPPVTAPPMTATPMATPPMAPPLTAPPRPAPPSESPFAPGNGASVVNDPFAAPRAAPLPQPLPIDRPSAPPYAPVGPSPTPVEPPMFAPVRPMPQGAPPAAPRAESGGGRSFLQAVAAGAGVSPDMFAGRDANEVAYEIGEFIKASVENLAQLLRARAAAKTMAKSSSRTMISAADNNPLKFIPVTSEAIEIMFARRRPGYLDARRSVESGFEDLKRHELATYTAMQKALGKLLDDFSPEKIEAKVGNSAFSSKKARAWELFVRRWEERSVTDNGILDVFLAYFAEAYDEANRKK